MSGPAPAVLIAMSACRIAGASAAPSPESVDAAVCRLIESSGGREGLPIPFLTRLIWRESSFRHDALSPAGAEGIAQFMPRTANERGLADPFDPEQAIPEAAAFLAGLTRQFGSVGLAAAAYNAGSARVVTWLQGHGTLPAETEAYVLDVTGLPAGAWMAGAKTKPAADDRTSCLQTLAAIRRSNPAQVAGSALLAPWGVQLAGAFSKEAALAAYRHDQTLFAGLLGSLEPMIVGGRKAGRGFRAFYQVRAPSSSRAAAATLCEKILHAGGACSVLRS